MKEGLKLLTSNETLLPPNEATISALRSKHPSAPEGNLPTEEGLLPKHVAALQVEEDTVQEAVNSMTPGSCGGLDGLRPLILQQLLSQETAESSRRLLRVLTESLNQIPNGYLPDFAIELLFGASLCAFEKGGGRYKTHSSRRCTEETGVKNSCST